jgi:hypothetical protein
LAKKAHTLSARGQFRKMFWEAYLAEHPIERVHGPATGTIARWRPLAGADLILSEYIALDGVGAFIRGPRHAPPDLVYAMLEPLAAELSRALQVEIGPPEHLYQFHRGFRAEMADFANWPIAIEWLGDAVRLYEDAVAKAIERG